MEPPRLNHSMTEPSPSVRATTARSLSLPAYGIDPNDELAQIISRLRQRINTAVTQVVADFETAASEPTTDVVALLGDTLLGVQTAAVVRIMHYIPVVA